MLAAQSAPPDRRFYLITLSPKIVSFLFFFRLITKANAGQEHPLIIGLFFLDNYLTQIARP